VAFGPDPKIISWYQTEMPRVVWRMGRPTARNGRAPLGDELGTGALLRGACPRQEAGQAPALPEPVPLGLFAATGPALVNWVTGERLIIIHAIGHRREIYRRR
jgi:hypothetical protein